MLITFHFKKRPRKLVLFSKNSSGQRRQAGWFLLESVALACEACTGSAASSSGDFWGSVFRALGPCTAVAGKMGELTALWFYRQARSGDSPRKRTVTRCEPGTQRQGSSLSTPGIKWAVVDAGVNSQPFCAPCQPALSRAQANSSPTFLKHHSRQKPPLSGYAPTPSLRAGWACGTSGLTCLLRPPWALVGLRDPAPQVGGRRLAPLPRRGPADHGRSS